MELAGIRAGRESSGHRFLGKARDAGARRGRLRISIEEELCLGQTRRAAEEDSNPSWRSWPRSIMACGFTMIQALAELVVYLNEYPSAILGDFDPSFLELPDEILITVMRGHQKYFALRTRDGTLAPHFLAVINLDNDAKGLVRAGHERVLARAICGRAFLLGAGSEMSARRLFVRSSRTSLTNPSGKLRRQSRTHAPAGALVCRAVVCRREFRKQAWPARTAPRSSPSAIWSRKWFENFLSFRASSVGSTRNLKENLKKYFRAVYDHYRPAGLDEKIPENLDRMRGRSCR